MKLKKLLLVLSLVVLVRITAYGQDQYRSLATGSWNTPATWEKSTDGGTSWVPAATVPGNAETDIVLIKNGHTITYNIDTTVISSLTIGEGSSGILKFEDVITQRALAVLGNVTLNPGSQFIHGLTATVIDRMYIGGNLSLGNASVLALASSQSRGGLICFNKISTGDQTITNSGTPTTIDFGFLMVKRGNIEDRVLSNINMNIKGGNYGLQLVNGIYEQSAGLLVMPSTMSNSGANWNNDFPNGIMKITGNSSVNFTSNINGTSGGQKGTIIINTTGNVNVSFNTSTAAGNNKLDNGGTLNILAGTVKILGRLYTSGTTNISGGSIFLDPQGVVNMSGTTPSYNTLEVASTGTFNMSGGSLTLVDPFAASGVSLDIKLAGNVNITGGTINIGDGISNSPGGDGFEISTGGKKLYNLVINNPSGTSRQVILTDHTTYSNLELTGNLNIIAGELTAAIPNLTSANITIGGNWTNSGTFTSGPSTLVTFNSNGTQQYSGNDIFKNVTLSNSTGLILNSAMNINGTLTLSSGILHTGNFNLTASTISGANATNYICTDGIGSLIQNVGNSAVLFPIGSGASSDYTPITFANGGTSQNYKVRVLPIIPSSNTGGLGRQWRIQETTNPNSTIFNSLTLAWNANSDVQKTLNNTVQCDIVKNLNGDVNGYDLIQSGITISTSSASITSPFTVLNDISSSGLYLSVVQSNAALPVELSTFSSNINGRNIQLNWETKTEKNSNKFQIERTISGVDKWEAIGSVKAADLSNSPKQYSFSERNLHAGKYQYRLKMIDNDGTFEYSKVIETEVTLPKNFDLSQNYPNPFNPSTKINYSIPNDSKVILDIYSISGEKVAQVVNELQAAGYYSVDFVTSTIHKNLSSGVYLYRIHAIDNSTGKDFSSIKKMVILK